jgi:adenosylcobinamide amidohydrolase/ABC-type Fe3+-hydroxamate transport system substrate-binding protein
MNSVSKASIYQFKFFLILVVFFSFFIEKSFAYPISIYDDRGIQTIISKKPERVISLVPGITEMIFALGEGESICGLTYFDTFPGEATRKTIVGGFLAPSINIIKSLQPDCLLISEHHQSIINAFSSTNCQIIVFKSISIEAIYQHLKTLGQIFNCLDKANNRIATIQKQFSFISTKTASIPQHSRKRVFRIMGKTHVMTPGIDSFQNEFIRLAGGIPHQLDRNGHVISIDLKEWKKFNPQVIYGCYGDQIIAKKIFQQEGWKDVDAVKNHQIFYFPCELTCRDSTHSAYFVTWLSALLYPEQFKDPQKKLYPERIVRINKMDLQLPFVEKSRIAFGYINDLECKTLMVNFKKPQYILSSLEGPKDNVLTVVNHYFQPAFWQISHDNEVSVLVKKICTLIDRPQQSTSVLLTAADMENLAVISKQYKEMIVYALVTAGVNSNAMRLSKDIGGYYKPGTINIIVMSNRRFTKRAMTRAIITATESKTAALWDMDIRSSYTPIKHPATGTGTDNIIIVQGTSDQIIDQTGGHTKAGELIAHAVYDAVQQSIFKQNSISQKRSVFFRLQERKIQLYGLLDGCDCKLNKNALTVKLERQLLMPEFASFMEMAFVVSDAYEQKQISDINIFTSTCKEMILRHTGHSVKRINTYVSDSTIPEPLQMALNTMIQISDLSSFDIQK